MEAQHAPITTRRFALEATGTLCPAAPTSVPLNPKGWGCWIDWPNNGGLELVTFVELLHAEPGYFLARRGPRNSPRCGREMFCPRLDWVICWEQPAPGSRIKIPSERKGGAP